MSKVKTIAKGAAIGAAVGTATIPAAMVIDAMAPVTYPLLGILHGVTAPFDTTGKLVCGISVTVAHTACIPFAPLFAIGRFVTQPAAGAILGGLTGLAIARNK